MIEAALIYCCVCESPQKHIVCVQGHSPAPTCLSNWDGRLCPYSQLINVQEPGNEGAESRVKSPGWAPCAGGSALGLGQKKGPELEISPLCQPQLCLAEAILTDEVVPV